MLTYAPRPDTNFQPLSFLLLLTIWLGLFCGAAPASAQFHFRDYGPHPRLTPPDAIQARGALEVDAQTGQILYARNPDGRFLPASTTKLMTALIVYEGNNKTLNGSLTIQESDRAEPSNVPLIPGETITVDKLFHALLIESANDSARALGRYIAGNNEAFVAMMNQRARTMGLVNTHFDNPNGLPAPQGTHFTSCRDLMQIFRSVIAYPELAQICSTREYTMTSRSGTHYYHNHNLLLGRYPGMGPAKTGWTVAARHTYAAAVTRNGRTILLTLLDSPDKWSDAQILFNWGFAQAPRQAGTENQP
jgi:D-alanyl-D-alanine carboxypeptidase (penicillin-binding protein 5/6)